MEEEVDIYNQLIADALAEKIRSIGYGSDEILKISVHHCDDDTLVSYRFFVTVVCDSGEIAEQVHAYLKRSVDPKRLGYIGETNNKISFVLSGKSLVRIIPKTKHIPEVVSDPLFEKSSKEIIQILQGVQKQFEIPQYNGKASSVGIVTTVNYEKEFVTASFFGFGMYSASALRVECMKELRRHGISYELIGKKKNLALKVFEW